MDSVSRPAYSIRGDDDFPELPEQVHSVPIPCKSSFSANKYPAKSVCSLPTAVGPPSDKANNTSCKPSIKMNKYKGNQREYKSKHHQYKGNQRKYTGNQRTDRGKQSDYPFKSKGARDPWEVTMCYPFKSKGARDNDTQITQSAVGTQISRSRDVGHIPYVPEYSDDSSDDDDDEIHSTKTFPM